MVNPELLKIIYIVVGGLIIGGGGQIILIKIKRKKKEEENMMYQNYSSNTQEELSEAEKIAKKYIEDYKSQYPKESIRVALINNGNLEQDVDKWINKYF